MARLYDDAQSEYSEVDSALGLSGVPISVSLWCRTDVAQNQCVLWIGDKDTHVDYHQIISTAAPGQRFACQSRDATGDATATASSSYSTNTWHQVGAVWAANNDRRIYMDGGSKITNATSRTPASLDRFSVGRSGDLSPTYYWSGDVCWVAVWNKALSDANMVSLAAGAWPQTIEVANLVAVYPFGLPGANDDTDYLGTYDLTAYSAGAGPNFSDNPPGLIYPGIARSKINGALRGLVGGGLCA